jgi:signal transduction histidine kinase
MAKLMRRTDWSTTPLGPVEQWPPALRTTVQIMLSSRYSMWMAWGPDLTFLYNDRYAAETLHAKHPWALGQTATEVWREIWPTIGPLVRHVLATGEATWNSDLLLFLERSGYPEETYHSFSYSPLYDDEGRVAGMLCVVTEETTRVLEERRSGVLRALASSLTSVLEDPGIFGAVTDTLATDRRSIPFAVVYGLDRERRRARVIARAGIDDDHPGAPAELSLDGNPLGLLDAAQRTPEPRVVELDPGRSWPPGAWTRPPTQAVVVPLTLGGASKPHAAFVAAVNPHRAIDDAYLGFLRLFVGQISAALTSAHAFDEEKRRAEALAQLDRAKTTFFSNISHELRTPITLLLSPIEEAIASDAIPEPERGSLRVAHRNALRLLKLVNALLEFSRIEAGRVQTRYEPVDLAAATREHASAFELAMAQGGLRFSVHTDEIGEPVYVDRSMWETIVLNLVSNAFKFTHEGEVEVRLTRAARRVLLVVRDTGVGIPEADLPRVFERFHRVEGTHGRSFEGTGIGLSLVHELVKLQGGTLGVKSAVGRGTTFTVELPLGSAHLDPERVHTADAAARSKASHAYVEEAVRWLPVAPSPPPPRATAAKVLVADDNADMREYLRRILSEHWSVVTASNGAEAMEAIRRERPDLVVSDVMMPVMDGFQMMAAVRAEPATRDVPILLLSARAGEEARTEGLKAGADDYLVKPFSARELAVRAQQLVFGVHARRAERAHREFLESLISQAPVAIAVWEGPAHVFQIANEAFLRLTGRDDVVGRPIREVYPESELAGAGLWKIFDEVYATGVTFTASEFEATFDRKRDDTRETGYFAFHVAALRNLSRVTGLVAVVIEVTEQVRARRRIEHLRRAAEDASRAKDEFLSVLSHELRTPLNAIVGWSSLLGQGRVAGDQVQKAMDAIERNARAQARLIDDLLDLSRIEQGKLVLSIGPVQMVAVVEAAIDVVRPAAEAKGVRLQPVLDSHATIVGDPDRLQQVVWNLLSNAIKFTPSGGRVRITLRRAASYVELAVADTGAGIDPAFLPQVFDRFRQADPSSRRKQGGLGLGLAIARSLVEMHGGVISVHSDGVGKGAEFSVRLPMAPLRADRAPQFTPEPGALAPVTFDCPPELAGRVVLVVDDEPDTRDLLRYVIAQCMVTVHTASNAADALRMIQNGGFDALISDIGMPEMDGTELITQIRTLPPPAGRVPAIALTAYARPEDRTRLLRAGFDMHVAKPVEPTELITVLASVMRRRSDWLATSPPDIDPGDHRAHAPAARGCPDVAEGAVRPPRRAGRHRADGALRRRGGIRPHPLQRGRPRRVADACRRRRRAGGDRARRLRRPLPGGEGPQALDLAGDGGDLRRDLQPGGGLDALRRRQRRARHGPPRHAPGALRPVREEQQGGLEDDCFLLERHGHRDHRHVHRRERAAGWQADEGRRRQGRPGARVRALAHGALSGLPAGACFLETTPIPIKFATALTGPEAACFILLTMIRSVAPSAHLAAPARSARCLWRRSS